MKQSQPGVKKDHAGTGPAHDLADFFPHFRAVTVNLTMGTYRFVFAQGAMREALLGVGEQLGTFLTGRHVGLVVATAISGNHHLDGFVLAFQGVYFLPKVSDVHNPMIENRNFPSIERDETGGEASIFIQEIHFLLTISRARTLECWIRGMDKKISCFFTVP